ncbi:MAG TPA: hypothetical protein VGW78_02935 [Candidatus Babeliales bacterium]|nr:hypothetical protein [Candidatus Babeliales bacterium]
MAKVAIFQQLSGQTDVKGSESVSFSFPRQGTHDWEEQTPNTRIEHKSGNTQLKTSRGNTNYSWGTNLLFWPAEYVLRKMVDAQQPRPQEDHTQQYYEKRYLDRSTPEQLFRSKEASDNYIKASEVYENGGRYSPGRTRYNKKLEIAKEILAAERDCPGSISESTFQDVKLFFENDQKYRENGERAIQKHHERAQKESNKVERHLEKKQAKRAEKAKKNESSNSGNNGKGPNRDPNRDPKKIAEDIKNIAELTKKVGDDIKNKVEEKARNWNEYFNTQSGQKFKDSFERTGIQNPKDSAPICRFTDKSKETEMFKEGWHYAPDRMHGKANSSSSIAGDHFEVWDKKGNWMGVANLDGSKNHGKTAQAMAESAKRSIKHLL